MLAERGILRLTGLSVKVIPQELATAASMTENGHRRDMHPAEQIAGFRQWRRKAKRLHKSVICWAIHPATFSEC
ncbi:hypothetical protein ECP02994383_5064 [Escherichia coli P0299438.3]|nr:hypothetical protein ECP02994383_5064 [Escherichia coli P0299438.3]